MLHKKDFKAIAEILASRYIDLADNAPGRAVRNNLDIVACDLADYLSTQNDRFDRDKFLTACSAN